MREMISEATRTIEDSQTAQALHGLLSLKDTEGTQLIDPNPAVIKGGSVYILHCKYLCFKY